MNAVTNPSYTWSATYSRSIETHNWPALEKHARTAPSAARWMSASRRTSIGFLPPSSRLQPIRRSPACFATSRPVRVEPVKQM
jgi:hypothetical protein